MKELTKREINAVNRRLHLATGELNYSLALYGDTLAEREGYKSVNGLDAVFLYLIKTYHWTPAVVKGMNLEDVRFVLSEEMHGWVMPPDGVF